MQEVSEGYHPSHGVVTRMGDISLTAVTGPAGVGKSTLMENTGLPRVVSDTIREPRINDGVPEVNGREYFFRSDFDKVLRDVEEGRFVQIALGPSGKSFYGSRIDNYPPSGSALMDLLTPTVPEMVQLPFRRVTPVHIVAPSLGEWIGRLDRRGTLAVEDRAARLEEANRSIKDALEGNKSGIEYLFIRNNDLAVAAASLKRVAKGEITKADEDEDLAARETAREILRDMDRLVLR